MKKIILFVVLLYAGAVSYGQSADETAIKELLEKESATWRSGDIKAHADCWVIRPYSRILVSAGDGAVHDIPPGYMINPPAGSTGKGGSAVNSNYKISISGNTAWVSHDEVSTAPDNTKTFSSEFRMLEKVDGQWKLVAQSIHIAPPPR